MAFPVSLPNDGLVDVMAMARVIRLVIMLLTMLTFITLPVFQNRCCCGDGWRPQRRSVLASSRRSLAFL